jgi:hypothetical protein
MSDRTPEVHYHVGGQPEDQQADARAIVRSVRDCLDSALRDAEPLENIACASVVSLDRVLTLLEASKVDHWTHAA